MMREVRRQLPRSSAVSNSSDDQQKHSSDDQQNRSSNQVSVMTVINLLKDLLQTLLIIDNSKDTTQKVKNSSISFLTPFNND